MTGDPIHVEFDFAELPLRQLMQKVQSFHRPNKAVQVLVSAAAWLVLFLGFLGLFQVGSGYTATGPEIAVIGFAAGMVVTVLVLVLLSRMMVRSQLAALVSARTRRGSVRIILAPDGLDYRSLGLSVHQSWTNIEEVVVVRDVTMIMPSRAEFYPVPHGSLPADVSPEDLEESISAWRKSSPVAP